MFHKGDRVRITVGRRNGMTGTVCGPYVPHDGNVMFEVVLDGQDESELFRPSSLMVIVNESK